MPIAAVPQYLGNHFKDASPGQRFGIYLPIWTARADQEADVRKRAEAKSREGDEAAALLARGMDTAIATLRQRERKPLAGLWDKNDFASRHAWKEVCAFTAEDTRRMQAHIQRQNHAFETVPTAHALRLQASATAPFTTGLGNEHPLENGFAFLNPYGLPYLPGSGIKGVLRTAAGELASGQWESQHWGHAKASRHEVLSPQGKHLFDASDLDVLFGSEALDGENHLRGVLSFWDVVPQIEGNSLMVEIMTPHQSHYYQQKAVAGSTNPHDSGSPNPISFLTVPPGSGFAFHVLCDHARLQHLAPDLAANDAAGHPRWKALLTEAFEHAFAWLGFGAKTAVGYGAMSRNTQAEERLARAQAQAKAAAAQAAKMASLSDNERQIAAFVLACQSRFEQLRGAKDRPNTEMHAQARALSKAALEGATWTAEEKRSAALALAEWLPQVVAVDMKDERKKLKLAVLRGEA
jgi:CRISPR-associated protein Cmr6